MDEKKATSAGSESAPIKKLSLRKETVRQLRVRSDVRTGMMVDEEGGGGGGGGGGPSGGSGHTRPGG